MLDVMIDLETYGQTPGCGIISIGAVFFSPSTGEFGRELYLVVSKKTCLEAGLHEDVETLLWWDSQSNSARKALIQAENGLPSETVGLSSALVQLRDFLHPSTKVTVWGNGSDFDNAILACAYRALRWPLPWKFWNNRCYRTLKNLHQEIPIPKRTGVYHNALDDAKTQAEHAMMILRKVRGLPEPAKPDAPAT